jgi:hypothetical protein
LEGGDFVLLGDLNASPYEGDSDRTAIQNLLAHPAMSTIGFPPSRGGVEHSPKVDAKHSAYHTAVWRMQADYVRPSRLLETVGQAVFWPDSFDNQHSLLSNTSDHRLVYLDVIIKP